MNGSDFLLPSASGIEEKDADGTVPSEASDRQRLYQVLARADPRAPTLAVDLLTAQIRNPHTRAAYVRAIGLFLLWLDGEGLGLAQAKPYDVARYAEQLGQGRRPSTVNLHLSAIRRLYGYLRERSGLESNPAAEIKNERTEKVKRTPYLSSAETAKLLAGIPTGRPGGAKRPGLNRADGVFVRAGVGGIVAEGEGLLFPGRQSVSAGH